jgi:hypothetical protein
MHMIAGVILLDKLYDYIRDEDPRGNSLCTGSRYRRVVDTILMNVPSDPGIYLWGRYIKKGFWENIYIGQAYRAKLNKRLNDELCKWGKVLWRCTMSGEEILARNNALGWDVYNGPNDQEFWERMLFAGSTHIIWISMKDIDTRILNDIEKELIEILNPRANRTQSVPRAGIQDQTIEVLKLLREQIKLYRKPPRILVDISDILRRNATYY